VKSRLIKIESKLCINVLFSKYFLMGNHTVRDMVRVRVVVTTLTLTLALALNHTRTWLLKAINA